MYRKIARYLPGLLCLLAACEVQAEGPAAIRLVDSFESAVILGGSTKTAELPPSTEWRFDGPAPEASEEEVFEVSPPAEPEGEEPEEFANAHGWTALNGVDDLQLRDGRLVAKLGESPLLHTLRPEGMQEDDLLHAVVVRIKAPSGERIGIDFDSGEKLKLGRTIARALDSSGCDLTTDLEASDEFQTITLTTANSSFSPSFSIADIRHVVLRIFGAAEGSEIELESVRLVSRREHLAKIPSGVSWQGCGEVYREAIVTRAPESVSLTLELPQSPWLELNLGTVEEGAVTFRVELRRGEGSSPVEETLLRRTVTTPDRWEATPLDLAPWAGERVTLTLALNSSEAGAIGLWGSPTVRNRGTQPRSGGASVARTALTAGGNELPRGVILIIADTLRRDHLDAYGYERATTPVLSRLAAEGALFEDNISQGSWTKVSVSSILTSMYPATHGIVDSPDRLPATVTTLAESFNRAGYATFATSSVPFTGKLTNLHQGVEVMHERSSLEDVGSKTARPYVDRFLDWLELHQDGPFFARLHVFDPHSPFEPRRPYDTLFAEPGAKGRHEALVEKTREVMEDSPRKARGLPHLAELREAGVDPREFTRTEIDWYDASIRAMDTEIGRLMERLEELGLADDVVIAFVADHGEEFLEHGEHWHGDTAYGEMTNVPLFVRWPGVVPTAKVATTVQSIDLFPTLLDLCRLPVPLDAQGQSLLPLLASTTNPDSYGWKARPAFSECRLDEGRVPKPEEDVECFSIVTEGWRLIHNTIRPEGHPEYELFDHRDDPLNQTNVASDHPDVVHRLAQQLSGWREWAESERIEEADLSQMSEAEVQQLRDLGYVQ